LNKDQREVGRKQHQVPLLGADRGLFDALPALVKQLRVADGQGNAEADPAGGVDDGENPAPWPVHGTCTKEKQDRREDGLSDVLADSIDAVNVDLRSW